RNTDRPDTGPRHRPEHSGSLRVSPVRTATQTEHRGPSHQTLLPAYDPNWVTSGCANQTASRCISCVRRLMSTGAVGLLVAAGVAAATHAQAATSVSCPVCATIFGTNDGETINGTSGDDIICAGAGNDAIDGRVGNDRIYAGGGDDVIVAGAGNDAIFAGSGGDRVSAGADVIYGDNPVGMVYFDPADTGADGNDVIDGGPGSDPIDGGAGNDIIFTGGDGSTRPSASITHGRPGNDV